MLPIAHRTTHIHRCASGHPRFLKLTTRVNDTFISRNRSLMARRQPRDAGWFDGADPHLN